MPVPVVVVAPMVPVSGAEVGRPGRWVYPRTVFRPPRRGYWGFTLVDGALRTLTTT